MVAGFRMGRGRDSAQQQAPRQQHGQRQQPPYGQPYGGQPAPPQAPHPQAPQQQWQRYGGGRGGQGAPGEGPEYFGGHDPYQGGQQGYGGPGHDPYANNPGHTQAFSINDGPGGYPGPGQDPYGQGNTYQGGHGPVPPSGPRLHWKQLLSGIVLRPNATFWQMRDYPVWGPALVVTFLYGMLAVFGFAEAREDVLNATLSNSIPWVLSTGLAVVVSGLILGAVTHTLARQLGGNGAWQPTVGLSMLIMSLTDVPRLLFAMFMSGDSTFVQAVGWLTWLAAGALFTSMVSRSHDLPWPKALGASAIQLLALLALLKLGTF